MREKESSIRKGKIHRRIQGLDGPRDALRLPNGGILIVESGKQRITEISIDGTARSLIGNLGRAYRIEINTRSPFTTPRASR